MKIVFNARFSTNKTGVGRVIEAYLTELAKIDTKNIYYIYVNKEFVNLFEFDNPNFHVLSNKVSAGNMLGNHLWTQTGLLWNIIRHKADLLILPQINLFILKLVPTILFQHDLIEYHIPNQKWYKLLFRKIVFPIAFKLSDKIIGVSKNTIKDIKAFFVVPEKKLVHIDNGVDLSLFRAINCEEAKQYIQQKHEINGSFILYTGTLALPQKNLLRLLTAYQNLLDKGLDYKLVMVGGNGKDSQLIFDKVHKMGLENKVIFTGYVPDEDLPFFYGSATVFCFPSLQEGFGLPVLEAMACGCPVVTSKTSSLGEISGDAAITVDPLDCNEITNALYRLLTNESLRNSYRSRGFERAKNYSWGNSANKLLNIINSFRLSRNYNEQD